MSKNKYEEYTVSSWFINAGEAFPLIENKHIVLQFASDGMSSMIVVDENGSLATSFSEKDQKTITKKIGERFGKKNETTKIPLVSERVATTPHGRSITDQILLLESAGFSQGDIMEMVKTNQLN